MTAEKWILGCFLVALGFFLAAGYYLARLFVLLRTARKKGQTPDGALASRRSQHAMYALICIAVFCSAGVVIQLATK